MKDSFGFLGFRTTFYGQRSCHHFCSSDYKPKRAGGLVAPLGPFGLLQLPFWLISQTAFLKFLFGWSEAWSSTSTTTTVAPPHVPLKKAW